MIYFLRDTVTQAVKVGYSKNPKKRLAHLQTATPNELVLLGTIQGGLEHEAAYHEKFARHKLQGEWFKSDILREVLEIIAKETSSPQQTRMNVLVAGDSDFDNHSIVFQALDGIHAKTPIAWVVTGGDRHFDMWAWNWANQNGVEIYRYYPKWKKYGRFAGFKVGPQMLRSMFDPKLLLAFLTSKVGASTTALIRRAQKARIPVVICK